MSMHVSVDGPRKAGVALALALCLSVSLPDAAAQGDSRGHAPVVEKLVSLMQARPDLRATLEGALAKADLAGLRDMDAFLVYLDDLVTLVPVERDVVPTALKVYFVVNQAPEDRLNRDGQFSAWMKELVRAWGEFLDTPASAAAIETFLAQPSYKVDDYVVGPSGWLTFNQFFARQVKPGRRPVAEPRNDRVIVSPADSVFAGQWDIDADSQVTVKGVTWAVAELLDGSPYQEAFRGGTFTHSFLGVGDYHRYHVPVAGEVKEVRNIHGRVYMDVIRKADGTLGTVDGETYQINQERGLVVIDSPAVGLVAVLPVGMSFVSSVNLTPEVGAWLEKGDEFGYFLFGGSDMVMLFQGKGVVLDAEVGKKYLQGQRIGELR